MNENEYDKVTIRGVDYYALKANKKYPRRSLYHADGSPVYGNFKYGRYGKALHREVLLIDDRNLLQTTTTGYGGSTGRGWGGYLVDIIK